VRSEGPVVNRPGRKAGIREETSKGALKARHPSKEGFTISADSNIFGAAPSALMFDLTLTPASRPGLFAGGPSGLKNASHFWRSVPEYLTLVMSYEEAL